jgi:hypothetical protein
VRTIFLPDLDSNIKKNKNGLPSSVPLLAGNSSESDFTHYGRNSLKNKDVLSCGFTCGKIINLKCPENLGGKLKWSASKGKRGPSAY